MRNKHYNVTLIDKIIDEALTASADFYLSKSLAHRHHKVNAPAFTKQELSLRAIERMASLGLVLEKLVAEHLKDRAPYACERQHEFAYLSNHVKFVQLAFQEVIAVLVTGHVISGTLEEMEPGTHAKAGPNMAHNAISHGLRKARETHADHHREFTARPVLARFNNAMKCTIDGKWLDAIRDVTIAVYMTELDIDPAAPLSTYNPVDLTGTIAVYDGE